MVASIEDLPLHPLARRLMLELLVKRTPDREGLFKALEARLERLAPTSLQQIGTDVLFVARFLVERGEAELAEKVVAVVTRATRRVAAKTGHLDLVVNGDRAPPPTSEPRALPKPAPPPQKSKAPRIFEVHDQDLDLERLRRLAEQATWLENKR